jgi:parallel beta-helix repeat protein
MLILVLPSIALADDLTSSSTSRTLTPSSETTCTKGICNLVLYSGLVNVQEDNGSWVSVNNAKSDITRYFNKVYVEKDKLYDIDFSYVFNDKINLTLWIDPKLVGQKIPISIWKCGSENLTDNCIDKTEKNFTFLFPLINTMEIMINYSTLGIKNPYEYYFKFGEHSTTIMLQTADSNNTDDGFITSYCINESCGNEDWRDSSSVGTSSTYNYFGTTTSGSGWDAENYTKNTTMLLMYFGTDRSYAPNITGLSGVNLTSCLSATTLTPIIYNGSFTTSTLDKILYIGTPMTCTAGSLLTFNTSYCVGNREYGTSADYWVGFVSDSNVTISVDNASESDTYMLNQSDVVNTIKSVAVKSSVKWKVIYGKEYDYFRFNTSLIPSGSMVKDASLNIFIFVWTNLWINIYDINDTETNWTEETINWSGRPNYNKTAVLNNYFINTTKDFAYFSFNITPVINFKDKTESFFLTENGSNGQSYTLVFFKEYTLIAGRTPYLNITYSASADTTAPTLTIQSPTNMTYDFNTSLPLNFTADDTSGISQCWFNLDSGTNVTLTNCNNATFNVSKGWHQLYLFANDTVSNNVTINVNFSAYSINLTSCYNLDMAGSSYRLISNIANSTYYNCINISTSNITLDCQGFLIDGKDVSSPASYGIYIKNPYLVKNISIINCILTDWYVGIYLWNLTNSSIINNTIFSGKQQGINIRYSHNSSFINNTAYSNLASGFETYRSTNNSFINNTAYSNSGSGFYIDESPYNTFINNTANSNTNDGFFFDQWSNNLTLINSTIKSNGRYGIQLYIVDNSTFFSNIISSNTQYGIYIADMTGNEINRIYNNFLNNTINVLFSGVINNTNMWNTTNQLGTRIYSDGINIGGNYYTNSTNDGYSDTCTDVNTDGFCDIPYSVEHNMGWQDYCNSLGILDCIAATGCSWSITCNYDAALEHNNTDYLPLSNKYQLGADTCTYSGSGDWTINCADACTLTTNTDMGGNSIFIGGTGTVNINANITNWILARIYNSCDVIQSNGNGLKM